MAQIADRLAELGLLLPQPLKIPPDMLLPFPWVNVRGDRAFVSGHGPQEADGSPAGPFGSLGASITIDEGREVARKVALSVLGSLQRELRDLDRITGWCRVFGMVNSVSGFDKPSAVINGFSELVLEVFGPEIGRHARTAVGVAGLPLNFAVEVECEVPQVKTSKVLCPYPTYSTRVTFRQPRRDRVIVRNTIRLISNGSLGVRRVRMQRRLMRDWRY